MNTQNNNPFDHKPLIAGDFTFRRYGMNLVLGRSIADNCAAASRLAYEVAHSGRYGRVLYINTYQGTWKLDECFARSIGPYFSENTQDTMGIYSSTVGELASEREELAYQLVGGPEPVKIVVINSLEFAARDWRMRERLLFLSQEWVTMRGITVIVFAEAL